jgi:hypothetical protein
LEGTTVIKPRCPDPELLGMLIENRLGHTARARVLHHAADCASCRRQLAIASLPPSGPLRASVAGFVNSGKMTVCAGLLLGLLVLRFLAAGRAPRPGLPGAAPRRPEPGPSGAGHPARNPGGPRPPHGARARRVGDDRCRRQ